MRYWACFIGCCLVIGMPGAQSAQRIINFDYGLYLADFDIDLTGNGRSSGLNISGTWGDREQSVREAGASFMLDPVNKFSGLRSQRIDIARASGSQGTLTVRFDPISDNRYFLPAPGTPVLVRLAYRAENCSNVRYRFRYRTGEMWGELLRSTSETTGGWQVISQIVPLHRSNEGDLFLRLYLEIQLGEGAASGRIWIDGVQAIAQPITVPMRTRPNSIKTAVFGGVLNPDWAQFLTVPIDFALASHRDIVAFQAIPNAPKALLYLNPYKSYNNLSAQWLNDLYDYFDADRNHPEWFLLDSQGNRIQDMRYPEQNSFFMDVGHPQAQQRVAERLVTLTRERSLVPEFIFLDNWSDWNQCQQYPTRTSMMPAWTALLNRLEPVIRRDLGAKLVINVGSRIGIFLDGNPGSQWLPKVDGVMQEGAFVIYNRSSQSYEYRRYTATRSPVGMTDASWVSTLRAVTSNADKYWFLLVQCDPNDSEMLRFAVASYLVMAHDKTILAIDGRGTPGADSFHSFMLRPELFVPLGSPIANYRLEQGSLAEGALFARDFQYGIVIVNPTENQTFQYVVNRPYKTWDGSILSAGTMLTIAPRRGVVLYAAPEIMMEITPSEATVLPGETLTFTVRYRNNGLVDATNVKISVPLPEGMEFVSSSTGGQYLNRQITWTLPQVRAGQGGTLTFQARVH